MSNLTNTFVGLIQEGVTSMRAISDPKDKALVAAELAKAVASTGLVGILEDTEGVSMTPEEAAETKEAIKEGTAGKVNKPAKSAKPAKPAKPVKPAKEESAEKPEEEPEIVEGSAEEQVEDTAPQETAAATESEDTEEWTDEAIEKYAAELDYINQIREAYGDEGIEASISDWSEGNYSTFEDITPLNVKGFAAYLEMLVAELDEAAE